MKILRTLLRAVDSLRSLPREVRLPFGSTDVRVSVDPAILHAQLLAPMTLAEVYAWTNAVRGQAAAKRDPQPANEAA